MPTLTRQDLQAIALAALNYQKPTEEQALTMITMAKASSEAHSEKKDDFLDIVEAAEFDMDVSGQMSEGLALKLADALLAE